MVYFTEFHTTTNKTPDEVVLELSFWVCYIAAYLRITIKDQCTIACMDKYEAEYQTVGRGKTLVHWLDIGHRVLNFNSKKSSRFKD